MQLHLLPVTPSDLDLAATLHGPATGDFVSPTCAASWPIAPPDLQGAKRRAEWSCRQQKGVSE